MRKQAFAAALLGFLLGSSLDAEQVGYAARVIKKASVRKSGTAWGPLREKLPIDRDSHLRTEKASAVVVLFQPHGFLHLGEKTWTIVRQWLDQARGCNKPKVVILEGDLRIVHGSSAPLRNIEAGCAQVEFDSPDVEGRTNGTDIHLRVGPELGTLVAVRQGEASVKPDRGDEVLLEAGEWMLVRPDGTVAVPPTPIDTDAGVLDDSPLLDCCDFRIDPPEPPFP